MADWRQNEPEKRARKPKGTAKPTHKRKTASTTGWKSKGKPSSTAPVASGRSWTGDGTVDAESLSAGALKKWIAVLLLFSLFAVSIVALFFYAFDKPRPLPLVIISTGDYAASELLENPYGNRQRERLMGVNPANVGSITFAPNGNDKALASLQHDKWLEQFDEVSGFVVPSGGPSRKVVAFYVSSLASFNANNELYLLSPLDSPFSQDAPDRNGIALRSALENIATAVQPGATAWVILDLQLPPVVTNLGDLDRPWATATSQALGSIEEDLQKRLLVTLPCDDGQRNWLAPEYSGSFFGHYFTELLAGRGVDTSAINPQLTLGEFAALLTEKTASAVATRRYATQTPIWLPEANIAPTETIRLLTIGDLDSATTSSTVPIQERLDRIDALWSQLNEQEYQNAYRWDPIGYGSVESQLLALEEIALYQPNAFSKTKERVASALKHLKRPTLSFGVSLIEDRARDTFFNGSQTVIDYMSIDAAATQLIRELEQGQLPGFWRGTTPPTQPEGTPPEEPPADTKLGEQLRPELVWQLYLRCSRRNIELWEEVFQPQRLLDAIEYAGQGRSGIEINLLKRLAHDIDWQLVDSGGATANLREYQRDAAPACAKALDLFDRIQTLATHPEPEVSWWLRPRLGSVEGQFLRGIDWLLANQFTEAQKEFAEVERLLSPIESNGLALAQIVSHCHRTLYAAPHLVARYLREYQLSDAKGARKIELQLKEFAGLIEQGAQIQTHLEQPTSSDLPSTLIETTSDMADKLAEFENRFTRYVLEKTAISEEGRADNSPQTFRRERIALLSPLLTLDARKALHQRTLEYFSKSLDSKFEQSDEKMPDQLSSNAASSVFLSSLRSESVRRNWDSILHSDARTGLIQQLRPFKRPDSENPMNLRSSLLATEHKLRTFASSFGGSPTLQDELVSTRDMFLEGWPWTAAWQRWNLSSAHQRLYQVERLAEASWGDGPVSTETRDAQLFYFSLATQYSSPAEFDKLAPVNSIAPIFSQQQQDILQASVERLKSMHAQFGDVQKIDLAREKQLTPVRVESKSWNAIANVFLRSNSSRRPWLSSVPSDRAWAVDLRSQEEHLANKFFDTSYWSNNSRVPSGVISIRGNTKSLRLDWPIAEKLDPVVLSLNRETAQGAKIQVLSPEQPPTINVLLLVDCSESMSTEISGIVEAGGGPTVRGLKLFDIVKKNLTSLLRQLERIHGREADVQIGLMPFGLTDEAARKNQLGSFLRKRQSDLNILRSERISSLDGGWALQLENAVRGLTASGDTPLYDAIVNACELAESQNGEQTFIYVFTDGVNHINANHDNDPTNDIIEKTKTDVENTIRNSDRIRVSIFHFNFFEQWIKTQESSLHSRWRNTFASGEQELLDLRAKLGEERFGYYNSSQADKLLEDSLARIPTSTVEVISRSESNNTRLTGELDEIITIPQSELPAQYDVVVSGNIGTAKGRLEAQGGEELVAQFKNDQSHLEYGKFNANRGTEPEKSGGKLASQVFLRPRLGLAAGRIGIELSFWNTSATVFTYRPRFLVAEVLQSGQRNAPTFLLADHRFTSGIHYPEAQLSNFPWPDSRPAASVRVWASDSLPNLLQQKTFEPGSQTELKDLSAQGQTRVIVNHQGDSVTVAIRYKKPPKREERVVVVYPNFKTAVREFQPSQLDEEHRFTLPEESLGTAVQLHFSTVADLQRSALAGDVTELTFQPFETD